MTEVTYYKSTIEDGLGFSALINSLGGQSLYRSLFGQYNFTSLVEYSYLTISVVNGDGAFSGFISVNDGLPNDVESFDTFVDAVSSTVSDCSVNTLGFMHCNFSTF